MKQMCEGFDTTTNRIRMLYRVIFAASGLMGFVFLILGLTEDNSVQPTALSVDDPDYVYGQEEESGSPLLTIGIVCIIVSAIIGMGLFANRCGAFMVRHKVCNWTYTKVSRLEAILVFILLVMVLAYVVATEKDPGLLTGIFVFGGFTLAFSSIFVFMSIGHYKERNRVAAEAAYEEEEEQHNSLSTAEQMRLEVEQRFKDQKALAKAESGQYATKAPKNIRRPGQKR